MSLEIVAAALAFAVFNAILLCTAAYDVRHYRIPNLAPALLALSGLVLAPPEGLQEALSRSGSVALVGLIAGALWLRGLMGGGDLKLLTACAVWIPLGGLTTFAMALGVASGLQGIATLIFLHRPHRPLAAKAAAASHLPYGLSITAAGLVWSLGGSGLAL